MVQRRNFGIFSTMLQEEKVKKSEAERYRTDYLKRRPGYESSEEREAKAMFTDLPCDLGPGDMSTDAIDFRKAMPDSNVSGMFTQPSQLVTMGTEQGTGARKLVDKVVGGFMRIANQWFCWRGDDNFLTYGIRVLLGLTLAVYVFYILYKRHLDRYLFQVKHTLPYILELDI